MGTSPFVRGAPGVLSWVHFDSSTQQGGAGEIVDVTFLIGNTAYVGRWEVQNRGHAGRNINHQ